MRLLPASLGLCALAACLAVPAWAGEPNTDWMSLPSFRQLWQREEIGRFDGVAGRDGYYWLTNDGGSLVAVDPVTGQNRWRTALPSPVRWHAVMVLVGGKVVVASQERGAPDVNVAQFDSVDGRVGWSHSAACPVFRLETAASRLYLRCESKNFWAHEDTLIDVNPTSGAERARVLVANRYELMPSGDFCMTDRKQVRCSVFVENKFEPRWTRPLSDAGRFPRLHGTGLFVVVFDSNVAEIFRARDGHKVFQRVFDRGTQGFGIDVDAQNERMFLFHAGFTEILRLRDGVRVGQISCAATRGTRLLQGNKLTIAVSPPGDKQPACLVDGRGRSRAIVHHSFFRDVLGDVVIARTFSPSDYGDGEGTLHGYSLSGFAPPANQLDDYSKVVAVLQHFPVAREAHDALAVLRGIPRGLELLGQAIGQEHGEAKLAAVVIAGVAKETHLLPALRQALAQASVPTNGKERHLLRETVRALAALGSPQAAEVLLEFWRSSGKSIAPPQFQADLQDEIQDTVWRCSAQRDWENCPDRSFPVGQSDLTKAVLGTSSPGRGEVLDDEGRWAVLCEARTDDDRNGRLSVEPRSPGGPDGDMLRPYLVLGSGPGTEIGGYLAADPHGRRLAVSMGTCLYVVDAQTGKATALRRGDGRDRTGSTGEHRAVDFLLDGSRLVYVRSNGAQGNAVMRDLAAGSEREIDPGGRFLVAAFFDSTGRYLVMDVAQADSDAALSSWSVKAASNRTCRREVGFSDTHEELFPQRGPQPQPVFRRRVLPLHGGPIEDAAHFSDFDPGPGHSAAKYELVPVAGSEKSGRALPTGPFRWQRRN